MAGRARGDLRAGADRHRVRRTRRRRSGSPTTRRTGWRPESGPATSSRPTAWLGASAPARSGSTPSTPPTSPFRSAASSSRASGGTRAWPRSMATPSSRRPGWTCPMTDDEPLAAALGVPPERRGGERRRRGGGRAGHERSRLPPQRPWAQPRIPYRTDRSACPPTSSSRSTWPRCGCLRRSGWTSSTRAHGTSWAPAPTCARAASASSSTRHGRGADPNRTVLVHAPRPTRRTTSRSAATGRPSVRSRAHPTSTTSIGVGGSATERTTRTSSGSARCSTASTSSPATRSSRSTSMPRSATSTRSATC